MPDFETYNMPSNDAGSERLRKSPSNLDAERALLGAILLTPESIHDVSANIKPESFYADKHREIFRAIMEVFLKGDPIDTVAITAKLKANGQLDRIGGVNYIADLTAAVPAAANAMYYAQLVSDKSVLRGLIRAAHSIADLGYQDPENVEHVMDHAEKAIFEVTNAPTQAKFQTITSTLTDVWNKFEALNAAGGAMLRGVPSGFTALDTLLAGFQPSDLIILAARPAMGKTTFAMDVARNAAVQHGKHVGIFSLEMAASQLGERMLASESGVDSWKLRTGKLSNDEEYARVQEAISRLAEASIHIDDQPGTNILKMRSSARRLKNEFGLDLLVVDYLQLMSPVATKASDSMTQQVTEISRSLKILARELNVPIIALSQLSRAVEQRGGKPRLSDLRDSGSIEQDADVVMFIHREDKMHKDKPAERPNIAEILVEKHRHGAVGSCELFFDGAHVRFLNLDNNQGHQAPSGGEAYGDYAQVDDF